MASFHFTSDKKPLTVFSMAGLADIVLLLLIFFLLTSNFIPQFGIQVNLPQADALAPNDPNHISVAVTKEGRYYVDQNEVPREGLFETISESKGTRTSLVLRIDKEADYEHFITVGSIAYALNLRVLAAAERGDLRPR